ncbi:MAG TPA: haloalkane dehalogenase [Puia sp.]|nr:haloalkane dehalogenase [Puia sp.]
MKKFLIPTLITLVVALSSAMQKDRNNNGSTSISKHNGYEKNGCTDTGTINPKDNHPRFEKKALDSYISYVDEGKGDVVVFLHGNPTSSYLWRNIITPLSLRYRCLAPDLIGMGKSGKSGAGPETAYSFSDQYRYLDAWFNEMHLKKVTLVIHDWGSALGFYWASQHPDKVKAIAYMEAIVADRSWQEFGQFEQMFHALRSPTGETMVLDSNIFIEQILPHAIFRKLSAEEMNNYRAPFLTRESRLPTLIWPRQIPVEGQPADVLKIVNRYASWLKSSTNMPKLYFNVEPGTIPPSARAVFATLPNQQTVTIKGIHYVQEDAPAEISDALLKFLEKNK